MKTEGGKPNKWSKDYPISKENPVSSSNAPILSQEQATRLNFRDVIGSVKKKFSWNRGAYSGPLEPDILPDEELSQLEAYEEKARDADSTQSDS